MARVDNTINLSAHYPLPVRAEQIKVFQDRVDKAKTVYETSETKIAALSSLEELTTKLRIAVLPFASGISGLFDQKVGNVLTTDAGNGSDYIEVTASSLAVKGQSNVKVNQIATAAFATINKVGGEGFALHEDINNSITAGAGGNLSINVGFPGAGGGLVTVNINAGDDIFTVTNNLNNALQSQSISLIAVASERGDGDYSLVIKNTATGAGNITCNFSNGYAGNTANPQEAMAKVFNAGSDASVTVDGVLKTNHTNNMNIYPGVDILLKKPNSNIGTLTVDIIDDGAKIVEKLEGLRIAYNEFADFVEIQDSSKDVDSPLFSSIAFNKAITTANSLTNLVPGLSLNNSSLKDIGLGLNEKNRLEINNLKLLDAVTNRIEDIKALFQNGAKITKFGANSTELKYIGINPNSLISRNTLYSPVVVNDDGAGNFSFTVNGGAARPAVLNGNQITFPGTELEGLVLAYNKTSLGAQSFNIVISQGLADRFIPQSIAADTKLQQEISSIKAENSDLQTREKKAEQDLINEQRRIDILLAELDLISVEHQQDMDYLDAMIDLYTSDS